MLSQTAVFTRLVRDHIAPAAVIVNPEAHCIDVVTQMREADASAAVVVAQGDHPVGIVTERDVSRRIAFVASPDTPVHSIMSTPVHTIEGEDYLHNAVAWMRRDHIRHMPVIDNGVVVGLLELDQVLACISGQSVAYIDLLNHERSLAGMRDCKRNQFKIASQLYADQVPSPEIQNLLTRLNHQLYRDAVGHCLQEMREAGSGAPPAPFEVIVMGSGGRGENFLHPDQDNGIIIADYPDSEHNVIDAWFIDFSERMTCTLNDIGFDYCHGNVMATNPLWRKTLSQWQAQLSGWIRKSDGQVLRLCDIFFDFVCVYGDGGMTAKLREHITHNAARPFFLREMFKVDEEHDVALGPFGWLLPDRQKGPNKGKLNLKITGTLPLVGAVRLLALRKQIPATSTLDRIAGLYAKKALKHNEEDYLQGAYRHISHLLLRQQLQDAEAGTESGNHVPLSALSKREKDMLVAGFKAIRSFRSRLRTELTGELF